MTSPKKHRADTKQGEVNLYQFVSRFLNQMRYRLTLLNGRPVKSGFTTRQGMAILQLATARMLREARPLLAEDLVYLAKVTSPVEYQNLAEKVALECLYNPRREVKAAVQTRFDPKKALATFLDDSNIIDFNALLTEWIRQEGLDQLLENGTVGQEEAFQQFMEALNSKRFPSVLRCALQQQHWRILNDIVKKELMVLASDEEQAEPPPLTGELNQLASRLTEEEKLAMLSDHVTVKEVLQHEIQDREMLTEYIREKMLERSGGALSPEELVDAMLTGIVTPQATQESEVTPAARTHDEMNIEFLPTDEDDVEFASVEETPEFSPVEKAAMDFFTEDTPLPDLVERYHLTSKEQFMLASFLKDACEHLRYRFQWHQHLQQVMTTVTGDLGRRKADALDLTVDSPQEAVEDADVDTVGEVETAPRDRMEELMDFTRSISKNAGDEQDLLTLQQVLGTIPADAATNWLKESMSRSATTEAAPTSSLSSTLQALSYMDVEPSMEFEQAKNEFMRHALQQEACLSDFQLIFDHPTDSLEWLEAAEKAVQAQLAAASSSADKRGHVKNVIEQLLSLAEGAFDPTLSALEQRMMQPAAAELITLSESRKALLQTIRDLKQYHVPLPEQNIIERATAIGLTREEARRLLNTDIEYLKQVMLTSNDFEEISTLIEETVASTDDLSELIDHAIKNQRITALGALAHHDLETVSNAVDHLGEDAQTMFMMSLSAGPGENLLRQWFLHRDALPRRVRELIKQHAVNLSIDLGIKAAWSLIGSSEFGSVETTQTRPFELGDDPDLVDLDETLEYILAQGKRIKDIEASDLLVKTTEAGRRAVVMLLDKSGSMAGEKLSQMAIAAAMVLFTLKANEVGIAFFESNTYVVKDILAETDLERAVSEILELRAEGGTMLSEAIQWAINDQLLENSSRERILMIFTDSEVFDHDQVIPWLTLAYHEGIHVFFIVPAFNYSIQGLESLKEAAKARVIALNDWQQLPRIIADILNEF